MHLAEERINLFDQGYAFDPVYTDFPKAFDSVPHKRLLAKSFKNFDIKGNALDWIMLF